MTTHRFHQSSLECSGKGWGWLILWLHWLGNYNSDRSLSPAKNQLSENGFVEVFVPLDVKFVI